MVDIVTFIPHSVAFPNRPCGFDALRALLEQLSRTDAMFWCARLNLALASRRYDERHELQTEIANAFLTARERHLVNAWAHDTGRAPGRAYLFFRAQLLDLLCWVALLARDLPSDGTTFKRAATRLAFAEAALIVGDAWGERVYATLDDTGDREADLENAMRGMRTGLEFSLAEQDPAAAIARGRLIYSYVPDKVRSDFLHEFHKHTHVTLDEFFPAATTLVAVSALNSGHATGPAPIMNIHVAADAMTSEAAISFRQTFRLLSQSPGQLCNALQEYDPTGVLRLNTRFDYLPLRSRPVLVAPDGRFLVIDAQFMADQLVRGPLFAVATALKGSPKANTIFGGFGDGFQAYVLAFLRNLYPGSSLICSLLHESPRALLNGDEVELADAAIEGVEALILLEIKGVFLADQRIGPGANEAHIEAIRKKYAILPGDSGSKAGRAVGVGQLVRNIAALVFGEFTSVGLKVPTDGTVYPVIVSFDELMAAPGVVDLLRKSFSTGWNAELQARTGKATARPRVAPLTIMTVRELELMDSIVRTRTLASVLAAYTSETAIRSFYDHLYAHRDSYDLTPSEHIRNHGMQEVARVAAHVFGSGQGPSNT